MREIERRIQSLAIIHQQFYESENISSISFSKALRNIVEGVREECPKELSSVPVIFDTEDALLELERAIPAGLIVAELTANAFFKWPGNGSGKGSLVISLRALDPGKVEIGLKSAGIALPEDFDFSGGDSLGGILVDSLAKQLQGEVTFTKGAAATATLRFTLSRREAEAR
jgi:two-component system sensor kinase